MTVHLTCVHIILVRFGLLNRIPLAYGTDWIEAQNTYNK